MTDRPWGNQPANAEPTRSADLDVAEDTAKELRLKMARAELRICELEAQVQVREGTVRELEGILLRHEQAAEMMRSALDSFEHASVEAGRGTLEAQRALTLLECGDAKNARLYLLRTLPKRMPPEGE